MRLQIVESAILLHAPLQLSSTTVFCVTVTVFGCFMSMNCSVHMMDELMYRGRRASVWPDGPNFSILMVASGTVSLHAVYVYIPGHTNEYDYKICTCTINTVYYITVHMHTTPHTDCACSDQLNHESQYLSDPSKYRHCGS